MNGWIDLHIHSNYSDGLAAPQEILELVRQKGLSAFALCDHDNVQGYFKIKELLRKDDPELIPGVELSAGGDVDDIHILGYFFDPYSEVLNDALEVFRKRRNSRGEKMLLKLKDMGITVPLELVLEIAGHSAIGRPHVADALLRVGAISTYESAFGRYIGNNCPAYVAKDNMIPEEATDLIHQVGGLAFLAHPGIGNAESYIEQLAHAGLDGIEIYHPNHSTYQIKMFAEMAKNYKMLVSGGSDYHGREGRFGMIGAQKVPSDILINMKQKLEKNRGCH
jgi:predicted metal-dependent phosphoesterase TrpH